MTALRPVSKHHILILGTQDPQSGPVLKGKENVERLGVAGGRLELESFCGEPEE